MNVYMIIYVYIYITIMIYDIHYIHVCCRSHGSTAQQIHRNHPKLHPRSAAAAELKALGLSKLPILEWVRNLEQNRSMG